MLTLPSIIWMSILCAATLACCVGMVIIKLRPGTLSTFTVYAILLTGQVTSAVVGTSAGKTFALLEGTALAMAFVLNTIVGAVNSGQAAPIAQHLAHLNAAYRNDAPYSTFLTNHDQDRLMSQLGGPSDDAFAKNRLAASILLTLPGTPFLYYGEEIGMTGTKPDPQIRTPMQWTPDPERTGFTRGEPWAPVNDNTRVVNLAEQRADPDSLWSHYRDAIALRRAHDALRRGTLEPLETDRDPLLAYTRTLGGQRLLVLANMGETTLRDFSVSVDGFEPGARVRGRVVSGSGRPRSSRANDEGVATNWQPLSRLGAREVVVLEIEN